MVAEGEGEHGRQRDDVNHATEREVVAREREFINRLSLDPATERGDLESVAKVVTESCAAILGTAQVGIWLFEGNETELRCFDQYNAGPKTHTAGMILLEHQFGSEFRALKESLYVDASDPLTDPRTAGYVETYLKPNGISSMLDMVVRIGGRNLGTVCFEHLHRPHTWKQHEIDFGLLVCAQLSILLERRLLKRTEAERHEVQERLSATLHSINDGVIGTDTEGLVSGMNAVAATLTGWTEWEATGKRIEDIVHLVDLESNQPIPNPIRAIGALPPAREACLVPRTGTNVRIAYDAAPIHRPDGRVLGAVLVLRDMTKEHRMREELLQARKMESVGLLAGGVAHDLNNILAPVLLLTDRLVHAPTNEADVRSHLETIHGAARRASEVTRQLLTFARRQPMAFRSLELNEIVTGFLGLLRRTVRKDIAIDVELASTPALLVGDAGQIEQVLLNLVLNAQDAMPRGGRIVIATERAELQEPRPGSSLARGPYVVLSVSDTGIGMDATVVDRIFDPFFTTKSGRGTGLGLSSAYGIVRQHRGDIDVVSGRGRGTTFRIWFPRDETPDRGPSIPASSDEDLGGTETILLVEDEKLLCDLVEEMLQREGYTVLKATHPNDALALAAAHEGTIDLLLTDVVMPDLNGKELYARLSETRNVDVIYMSAYQDELIAREGVLEPGLVLVPKPFSRIELLRHVRDVVSRKRRVPAR